MTVNVEAKLGTNKFLVDEENPHIVLKENADRNEFRKLVIACPAGLYVENDDGTIRFDYAGCVECGTCRVLCGSTILEKWEFPQGSFGIEFRQG
ncbi:ferredoxin family protein [Bacillus sp. B15-48]|uniref:ferredoxin family protein n=1 Tax=Bacillus sp. B15-48 TaxID=1548601 RepID=UPI00193FE172|nr:ferredoxin family protein [Bacillus sp. B15-48]MBM4764686.1 ferredoxin family protein [Bacillus sp. B15-48]